MGETGRSSERVDKQRERGRGRKKEEENKNLIIN